jgi:hypothetical protein
VSANIGVAALHLGDDRVVLDLHARQLAEARENGALVAIVHALTRRSFGEIVVGDWTTAEAGAAEALDLPASNGQPALTSLPHAWPALLAALRDRPEPLAEHLAALDRLPPVGVAGPIVANLGRWAWAPAADTASGALHHLQQTTTFVTRMAAFDRVETAIRAERADLVRRWVAELAEFGTAAGARWALAAAGFGRALLGDGDVVAEFVAAIEHADAAGHRSTGPASNWPTASTCGGPGAGWTPGPSCGRRWRCSTISARIGRPGGRPRSCARPASPLADWA